MEMEEWRGEVRPDGKDAKLPYICHELRSVSGEIVQLLSNDEEFESRFTIIIHAIINEAQPSIAISRAELLAAWRLQLVASVNRSMRIIDVLRRYPSELLTILLKYSTRCPSPSQVPLENHVARQFSKLFERGSPNTRQRVIDDRESDKLLHSQNI